jgi:hypothetical protein
MPRFFSDFDDGSTSCDEEGVDCSCTEDASHKATQALGAIVADALRKPTHCPQFSVSVRSEEGLPVYAAILTFRSTTF